MPTFRVTLEYDGAAFEGWQVQPAGHRTVQGVLEQAIARICGERIRAAGAGRTDKGVHAEGQVASFRVGREIEPRRLCRALNGVLPRDVAALEVRRMADDFHARKDALRKLYRYTIWNGPSRSPLREARSLRVERRLDLPALGKAAADLVGTHDFAAFQAAGSDVQTSIRTLERLEADGEPGGEVRLLFQADGFLRHMVRILVGTLLQVASGRREPDSMAALLAARERSRAGPTAPPHGLTLVWVEYPHPRPRV